MPEIALTQVAGAYSARLEYRPASHPARRRAQSHGCGPLRRRPPSARHALRGPGGQQHRARPRRLPRCCGRESPSRRRRGDDAGQPAAARPGSGREDQPLHVPARPAAERPGALRQPADRGRDRRDARGRDRRRRAACRRATRASRRGSGSMRRESFVPPGVGIGNPAEVHRGDVEAGLAAASKRIEATYETAPQYHNAMEPHAIVAAWDGDTLSIDTPSQGLAMAQGRIAGPVRHLRPRTSISAARSSAAASAPRASSPGRSSSASWRRAWSEGRSSWCCAASRCTARSAIGRRRARRLRMGADGERQADRDRSSHQDDVEHFRRLLRAGLRRFAYALCQPGHRHLA